jgi:hypothetical protein
MEEKRKEIEIGGILLQMSGTPSLESKMKFFFAFKKKNLLKRLNPGFEFVGNRWRNEI